MLNLLELPGARSGVRDLRCWELPMLHKNDHGLHKREIISFPQAVI